MPFVHVKPDCSESLQGIADSLWKSKKVVVVTGAGISTNSGIPDFRSEHGLYSMIQAQFDAASDVTDMKPLAHIARSESSEEDVSERPAKRRRISDSDHRIFPNLSSRGTIVKAAEMECIVVGSAVEGPAPLPENNGNADEISVYNGSSKGDANQVTLVAESVVVEAEESSKSTAQTIVCAATSYSPGLSLGQQTGGHDATDQASYGFPLQKKSTSTVRVRTPIPPRLQQNHFPLSSSPLSSPPPILFDPYDDSSIVVSSSPTSRESSSSSETEDSPPSSQSIFGSQLSNPSRSTLPNLKGRDLFDVSIWSDPLKTSVFYAFTTTLRQKARASTPTGCHYFISHLRDTGKLVRCYTQNIDQMEEKVGLSTGLALGPGSRGRFSTRSARSSGAATPSDSAPVHVASDIHDGSRRASAGNNRGVECVFLHGSLHALRCFQCGQITNWDDEGREHETLAGGQPTCPHCEGATAKRQERGKRALGIGKLRPDIVLYGEEHPSADLISPIIQHDLSLAPDMLLILGTSLKVHGLKVMVREFAKAVHNKGGKVVFVNYTKPAESTWSDVIDYWVQWDCDAWVEDMKERKPILWLPPGSNLKLEAKPASTKKRQDSVDGQKPKKQETCEKPDKPEPKRPMAIRDDKINGAYLVCKILRSLEKISGRPSTSQTKIQQPSIAPTTKPRRARKSAPAILENRPVPKASPAQRLEHKAAPADLPITKLEKTQPTVRAMPDPLSSSPLPSAAVAAAVKSNPRTRKRKTMFGDEPVLPQQQNAPVAEKQSALKRRRVNHPSDLQEDKENVVDQKLKSLVHPSHSSLPDTNKLAGLALPPLRNIDSLHSSSPLAAISSPYPRPTPLEPLPVTTGPLSTISPNIIGRWTMEQAPRTPCRSSGITAATLGRWKDNPFFYQDALASYLRQPPPLPPRDRTSLTPTEQLLKEEEAAISLSVLRDGTVAK